MHELVPWQQHTFVQINFESYSALEYAGKSEHTLESQAGRKALLRRICRQVKHTPKINNAAVAQRHVPSPKVDTDYGTLVHFASWRSATVTKRKYTARFIPIQQYFSFGFQNTETLRLHIFRDSVLTQIWSLSTLPIGPAPNMTFRRRRFHHHGKEAWGKVHIPLNPLQRCSLDTSVHLSGTTEQEHRLPNRSVCKIGRRWTISKILASIMLAIHWDPFHNDLHY